MHVFIEEAEIDLYAHFVFRFTFLLSLSSVCHGAFSPGTLDLKITVWGLVGGTQKALGSKHPQFTNEAVKLALQEMEMFQGL